MRTTAALSEPPEGVVTGDSVPRENEDDDWDTTAIDRIVATLKTREEYREMKDERVREKARELYEQEK